MKTNLKLLENTRNYRKTKKGLVTNLFHKMKSRNNVSFDLNYLQEFAKSKKFERLFIEWEESGYKKELKPFVYKDKGSMATIGRNKAVVDLPKFKFSGVFAWFVWMFVHLFSLIGFKNKAVVFLNWVYNYIRFDREARLIMRPYKKRKLVSFTSDEL